NSSVLNISLNPFQGLFPLAAEFTIPLCSFEDVVLAHGNAIQFGKMIKATTRKNALLSYNGYGCFCGLGGKGTPVDATDRCCHAHDCCYRRAKQRGCKNPVITWYKYRIRKGRITCQLLKIIMCLFLLVNASNSCKKEVCECDRAAALCFKHTLSTYKRSYLFYPSKKCGKKKLTC
ncbi:acidic phospholipase A2 PLA-1, partial [Alligator mississippiensis]|uniref:acidic phospholipase A2 PLA-1 n=1 Tax=Alligator mississippiensis TaxID=8496 RepID=UPI0028775490